MAERSVTAFNSEFRFPHLQVFADRNRIEKEETFEIPSAARDRFLMEILIEIPTDSALQRQLLFDPKFHDVDQLLAGIDTGVLRYQELNTIGALIQNEIKASETLQHYALELCQATRQPARFGIVIDDIDSNQLIQAGVSPRGMSMMLRAARVVAWLHGRGMVVPEDIHTVFFETIAHRVFFKPVYELRRSEVAGELMKQILNRVVTP